METIRGKKKKGKVHFPETPEVSGDEREVTVGDKENRGLDRSNVFPIRGAESIETPVEKSRSSHAEDDTWEERMNDS